jgi:hypothetical protein
VSAGNVGDASVAAELIEDLVADRKATTPPPAETDAGDDKASGARPAEATSSSRSSGGRRNKNERAARAARAARRGAHNAKRALRAKAARAKEAVAKAGGVSTTPVPADNDATPAVYGDAAYGSGEFLDHLASNGIASFCKTQPPHAPAGRFAKDDLVIDLGADTVTCPNAVTVAINRDRHGDGVASFGAVCSSCPLKERCTDALNGRSVTVGRYEARLADQRALQRDPDWREKYRSTRPKVERRLAVLMRRRHGGRRARVRGRAKVDADFNVLAAAHNLARLAGLGLSFDAEQGWAART